MAFHPYPQVIRAVFNPQRFGPPRSVTTASTCPRVDRHGFGSAASNYRPIQTRFRYGSGPEDLNLLLTSNSPDHNAKGTPSGRHSRSYATPSDCLLAHGFRIYFTRHQACFSPFPHGTSSLSVTEECLALEGGPPCFPQDSSCPTVLGIPLGAFNLRVLGCHHLWRAFPGHFCSASCSPVAVPQPRWSKPHRFGLAPVRSPLLGGSRLLSLPPGT